jgi:hypothetical protein
MKYASLALIALSIIPANLFAAESPNITFSLTPEAVYADAGRFNSLGLENLYNNERGFVWLSPSDISFDQACLYLGANGKPVTFTGVTVEVYGRGQGVFPSGGSNTFVAESRPMDFTIAPVADPNAYPTSMQPYCFDFDETHTLLGGHAYVFGFDLNAGYADNHLPSDGSYLAGGSYRSSSVTHQVYTGWIGNTDFWAGFATPFELRKGADTHCLLVRACSSCRVLRGAACMKRSWA